MNKKTTGAGMSHPIYHQCFPSTFFLSMHLAINNSFAGNSGVAFEHQALQNALKVTRYFSFSIVDRFTYQCFFRTGNDWSPQQDYHFGTKSRFLTHTLGTSDNLQLITINSLVKTSLGPKYVRCLHFRRKLGSLSWS